MPKLSVIVSLYNKAAFIGRTIQSAVEAAGDKEVIVIDDGSIDGSYEIAERLASKHQDVILLRNPEKGTVSATNYGIAHARGEHIFILDGDDVCLPWRYTLSCGILDSFPQIALVSGTPVAAHPNEIDAVWSDCRRAMTSCKALISRQITAADYYQDNLLSHSQCAFRRTAWEQSGGYRNTFATCLDFDFYVRTLAFGEHWILNVPLSINIEDVNSIYARSPAKHYVSDFRGCQRLASTFGPLPLLSRVRGDLRYAHRLLMAAVGDSQR